jgi:26S proteasome regulatory subunit N9
MKAMALGLIRGKINEEASYLSATWVHPRILDRKDVGTLLTHIERWHAQVKEASRAIQATG